MIFGPRVAFREVRSLKGAMNCAARRLVSSVADGRSMVVMDRFMIAEDEWVWFWSLEMKEDWFRDRPIYKHSHEVSSNHGKPSLLSTTKWGMVFITKQ